MMFILFYFILVATENSRNTMMKEVWLLLARSQWRLLQYHMINLMRKINYRTSKEGYLTHTGVGRRLARKSLKKWQKLSLEEQRRIIQVKGIIVMMAWMKYLRHCVIWELLRGRNQRDLETECEEYKCLGTRFVTPIKLRNSDGKEVSEKQKETVVVTGRLNMRFLGMSRWTPGILKRNIGFIAFGVLSLWWLKPRKQSLGFFS